MGILDRVLATLDRGSLPSYSYVRGRFIAEQEERERPEGGTTLGRSEQRSGSGRPRRPRADLTDFDGFHNGPASDGMIFV